MDLMKELKGELKYVCTRIDDMKALYEDFKRDRKLLAMQEQAEFMLDIIEETDLLVYGYNKYIHEAQEKAMSENNEMLEGRISIIDFCHLKIDIDEVFDGYPDEYEIAERSNDFLRDEYNLRQEAMFAHGKI